VKLIKSPNEIFQPNKQCLKITYSKHNDTHFLHQQDWQTSKANESKSIRLIDMFTNNPGHFLEYNEELPSSGPAPLAIIHTDYKNIMVQYSCKEYGGSASWNRRKQEYFSILTRNSNYNDLDIFTKAFDMLRSMSPSVDMNNLVIYSNQQCK
jgi:hypothetical protein